jgi:hypothetical protein
VFIPNEFDVVCFDIHLEVTNLNDLRLGKLGRSSAARTQFLKDLAAWNLAAFSI